jgi:hypothetical protein
LPFGSIAESFEGLQKPPEPRRGHSSSTTSGRKDETHHPPLKLDLAETGSDQRCERKAAQWGNKCDPMKSKGNPNLDVGFLGGVVGGGRRLARGEVRPSRERRHPRAPPNPSQSRIRGPFRSARRGTVALGQETPRGNRPNINYPRDNTPIAIGGRGNGTGVRRVGPGDRTPFFLPCAASD